MSDVWLHPRTRVTVAQMAGESREMDAAAKTVLRSVKRVAAGSILTGSYISKLGIQTVPGEIGTGRSVKDRLVVADDAAAISIEYGHLHRFKNSRRVKWIPGKRIMTRGMNGVATDV